MNRLLLSLCLVASLAFGQIHVNDAGTLREATQVFVNDNGTLREIQEGYVNDNGTLRQVFTAGTVTVTGGATISHTSGVLATAALSVNADCTIDKSEGGTVTQLSASTDWVRPATTNPGFYEVMLTVVSGAEPSGSSDVIDTWLSLSTDRAWAVSTSSGTVDAVWRVSIRKASGGSALDTGDYTIDLSAI